MVQFISFLKLHTGATNPKTIDFISTIAYTLLKHQNLNVNFKKTVVSMMILLRNKVDS